MNEDDRQNKKDQNKEKRDRDKVEYNRVYRKQDQYIQELESRLKACEKEKLIEKSNYQTYIQELIYGVAEVRSIPQIASLWERIITFFRTEIQKRPFAQDYRKQAHRIWGCHDEAFDAAAQAWLDHFDDHARLLFDQENGNQPDIKEKEVDQHPYNPEFNEHGQTMHIKHLQAEVRKLRTNNELLKKLNMATDKGADLVAEKRSHKVTS